jgi:hypothetical protein
LPCEIAIRIRPGSAMSPVTDIGPVFKRASSRRTLKSLSSAALISL